MAEENSSGSDEREYTLVFCRRTVEGAEGGIKQVMIEGKVMLVVIHVTTSTCRTDYVE